MKLVMWLAAALLVAGVVENLWHVRALGRVPVRILVNGTRGKTSVTRLMTAVLREAGWRVWGKSTGSEAAVLLPDGGEELLVRRTGPRLTEQVRLFRRAARDGAQAVVVECMAVRIESQFVMGARLVRPTLTLMTNARVDHVAEMGPTHKDTVRALAFSLGGGAVVTGEGAFAAYVPEQALIPPDDGPLEEAYLRAFAYPVFEENVRLVLAAAAHLGIGREIALRGMLSARPDAGMAGPFAVGDCLVINGFAANDCLSSQALMDKAERDAGLEGRPVRVVFNNRADREYRLREFVPLFAAYAPRIDQVIVAGENARKVARYYARRTGLSCRAGAAQEALQDPPDGRWALLCLGNIKGAGREFIEELRAREAV